MPYRAFDWRAFGIVSGVLFPVWMAGGAFWGYWMMVFEGWSLEVAIGGGTWWGFTMWLLMGNGMAALFAWQRRFTLPAPDVEAFRAAAVTACEKFRFRPVSDTGSEIVFAPRGPMYYLEAARVVVTLAGGTATVRGSAVNIGTVVKAIRKATEVS